MTQYIYLASPVKLPQGSYGQNPVYPGNPIIFRTELDFIHLAFENNYDPRLKQKFSYSQYFSYDYQVAAYANHIPFKYRLKGTPGEEKCLRILYDYMEKAIQTSGTLEYFTSLNGWENKPLEKRRSVRWTDLKDPYDLVLEDREFWEITV
ncbi:hypothetical protein AM500_19785 [Bacillus sp. FJAT-18017]|uniref:hypothetical protein n=1 Tax=Bacillus sp. FJAT-18017 TaxID=1705566 RepID=UPI0006AED5E2|nr:hypothetical protein [Bacillus sp. FJAT-18017]ALC91773.1 hypothetical protein AM500_19785 [Bacillus sp. FJAT-18017]